MMAGGVTRALLQDMGVERFLLSSKIDGCGDACSDWSARALCPTPASPHLLTKRREKAYLLGITDARTHPLCHPQGCRRRRQYKGFAGVLP